MAKKLFIKTYGCQMNVYDSARMADVLGPIGYETTDSPDDADMVILNTCHIREKASEKVYSELGRLRVIKDERAQENKNTLIAVAGCVAQAEGGEILKRAPQVDIVLGPQTYHRLPEMIARAERENGGVLDTDFPADAKFDHLPDPHADGVSAFLSVQEGCDKFCTYCVVPYTRGAEFSRPVEAILAEAKALLADGVREITLIGQNVNAFHGDGPDGKTWGLGRLIYELADVDGLARLRYTTSHPMDMADDLFDAHRDVPALMPFVHLPVQSGSDTILKAMNRSHSADDFRRVVERLRGTRDDLALSSDFIVGFPGETDNDFRATMDLIDEIGFVQAFSFMYSPRPGTPAAVMPDQIDDAVKAERLQALQALLMRQQVAFNKSCEGRVLPILFDRPGRYDDQLGGRSPYMQPVHAAIPPDAYGQVIDCRIVKGSPNSLTAEPVTPERAIA